jgi:hypothetical protein
MIEAIMGVGSGLLKLHLHHEQLLLQILNHQLVQILLLIKIKKNENRKLKSEACRNDRARQKRTLSRSITRLDDAEEVG